MRAPNQTAWQCAGFDAVAVDHFARDDGGVIAFGSLHHALAVSWQVVEYLRWANAELVEVDDVDVSLLAHFQQPAVVEADGLTTLREYLL